MTKRVFILGAGFSKQAGMPLATELTKCLLNDSESPYSQDMLAWIADLKSRIAHLEDQKKEFELNIEQLFVFAKLDAELWRLKQQSCDVGRLDGDTPWSKAKSIENWLSHLELDIQKVIWEKQRAAEMRPILKFVEHLSPSDTVVTFNYDTLVETALTSCQQHWNHGLLDHSLGKITVLKMHGSVDWLVMKRGEGNPRKTVLLFASSAEFVGRSPLRQATLGAKIVILKPFGGHKRHFVLITNLVS